MLERRKAPRRTFNRVAQFHSDDNPVPSNCIVTDISDGGARLYSDKETPESFKLSIFTEDTRLQRECRVIWRLGGEVGVEFV